MGLISAAWIGWSGLGWAGCGHYAATLNQWVGLPMENGWGRWEEIQEKTWANIHERKRVEGKGNRWPGVPGFESWMFAVVRQYGRC